MIAEVIVDVPDLPALDYLVPEDWQVAIGDRVMVNVRSRLMSGIVVALKASSNVSGRLKKLHFLFKDTAPLRQEWLALTKFSAQYYIRSWGEAALPTLPAFFRRKPRSNHLTQLEKFRTFSTSDKLSQDVPPPLNAEQQRALEGIGELEGYKPFVLFGVTGSGKTEVYLRLIERLLSQANKQVLLLVPEINLTPQLEQRIKARFPNEIIVTLHSACSEGERAKAWLAAHEGVARIVIGTRLSIFASFQDLGLIIVDEEHDLSFKAGDGLRYSARDLAIWRAYKNNIPVVLGSATPSLETWLKVKRGTFSLLTLKNRATGEGELPAIELTSDSEKSNQALTDRSYADIQRTLAAGEQVLIFINRRGYSPSIHCSFCGWVATCQHCSVRLVFHKHDSSMVCHHCGAKYEIPTKCPECGNLDLKPRGVGTERIEEELKSKIENIKLLRIDRDSVSRKHEAEKAFEVFHEQKANVMVGTQMIAKGHDFKNIGLVVILNVDAQLLSPDTRAKENLFSTLMQVAGRAGRGHKQGHVVIQTNYPTEPFFSSLLIQDYQQFADSTLKEREQNYYVPFIHQALISAQAQELDQAISFLSYVAELADGVSQGAVNVFDPVPMVIMRFKDQERAQLLIEALDRKKLNHFLWQLKQKVVVPAGINWTIEVDPLNV